MNNDRLKSFIERAERLQDEKAAILDDIKELFAEAKGEGYDAKVIKKVMAIRKKGRAEHEEEQTILDLYLSALGME